MGWARACNLKPVTMTSKCSLFLALFFVAACGPRDEQKPPAGAKLPSYLVGTYARGTRVVNSVSVPAEDRAIRFTDEGRYFYRQGESWSAVDYRLEVTDLSVKFVEGPLKGQMMALSSVSPNCRIVMVDGDSLFRDEEVAGCPMSRRSALSARDCEVVGTWRQNVRSGELGGTLVEASTIVRVEADRFFVRSRATTRCSAGACRYDEAAPEVGTWSDVRALGLDGFEHVAPAECLPLMPRVEPAAPPVAIELVTGLTVTTDEYVAPVVVEPTQYGRCTSAAECNGACSEARVCTSFCTYDAECPSPGDGMIASCIANGCVAKCSSGNACPSGTACRDGRCL